LFRPKTIAKVTSATREATFDEGRDYVFDAETNSLRLPEGSRIPFKTLDELYPLMTSDAPKIARQAGDKTRGVFFDNADGYHNLQIEVTYAPEPGQWQGPVPAYAGDSLPHLMRKLKAKQPIRIQLCGDSISAGYNASKFSNAKPGCPAYGELFALGLEKQFGSPVTFTNFAVGGWGTGQGLAQARENHIGREKPDLVIIAFGMNDVFGRNAAAYQQNIRDLMATVREDSPETEFLLVATMLGNAEWGMPMDQFPLYREALRELTGPGVVLADLTAVWEELLKHKSFYDLCGNGVNHPNDFGHGIYAQVLAALVIEPRP
jgi:lysophospholipase L1-like esterase